MLKPRTMLRSLHLFIASLCVLVSFSQKSDTLFLYYKPDKFNISEGDRQRLDSFLSKGWDKISINGYTDETDDEEHNIDLSEKRSGEVYRYVVSKKIDSSIVSNQYFGESMPIANNNTEEGRALNRRTQVIGYKYPRVGVIIRPKEDPMKPVTRTLDNGIMITYRPGLLPEYMASNFEAGSGINFSVISNTVQMRENNLYNNTTNGDILSSVLILCPGQINPCKLDSPVLLRVPIPYIPDCNIQKVKFFNTVMVDGKRIWQEQNKTVFAEYIGDRTYLRVPVDSFCGCVNFDFKIPECYDTDSTRLLFVNADIKNLSAELVGLNSVYLPQKINDSTRNMVFVKNKLKALLLSFSFYKGKKRIRSFRDEPVTSFPYDSVRKQYLLSSGHVKFYFPGLNVYAVTMKVNNDKYWSYPDENRCELKYVNRAKEKILVDLMVAGRGKKVTLYHNQPLESFPYDKAAGCYVADKELLKLLKVKGAVAGK